MARILVTGASRGIGLEFTRQFVERGDRVFAACRQPMDAAELQALIAQYPDQITAIPFDAAEPDSIASAASEVGTQTDALDVLINNAGVIDRGETLATLNQDDLVYTFRVNAFAPVLLVKHLLDLVKRGTQPQIVNITSEYGSLTDKRDGDYYAYCASKAALNMFTRTLAFDLESDGISAYVIDPGWVQTRMGGFNADLTPEESVTGMLKIIDRAGSGTNGKYWRWNGRQLPW